MEATDAVKLTNELIDQGLFVVAEFDDEDSPEPNKVLGGFADHEQAQEYLDQQKTARPQSNLDIIL